MFENLKNDDVDKIEAIRNVEEKAAQDLCKLYDDMQATEGVATPELAETVGSKEFIKTLPFKLTCESIEEFISAESFVTDIFKSKFAQIKVEKNEKDWKWSGMKEKKAIDDKQIDEVLTGIALTKAGVIAMIEASDKEINGAVKSASIQFNKHGFAIKVYSK